MHQNIFNVYVLGFSICICALILYQFLHIRSLSKQLQFSHKENQDLQSEINRLQKQNVVYSNKIDFAFNLTREIKSVLGIDNSINNLARNAALLKNHAHIEKEFDSQHPAILPIQTNKYWISSDYGKRKNPVTGRQEFHKGIDLKTQSGVPVIATADGKITKIEYQPYFGNIIEITHPLTGYITLYSHLKSFNKNTKLGDIVKRSDVIGYVGNTGRSTGSHLHYGVFNIEERKWKDPKDYIFDVLNSILP